MVYGYARVSTKEQNESRQILALNEKCDGGVFLDKQSGKDLDRPNLRKVLNLVKNGDTLIVESFSRLSRNMVDLLNTVNELERQGVHFISLKEQLDTSTPSGRLAMGVFASLYQYERECLLERQREGIEIAKAEGKYKGRKPIELPRGAEAIFRMVGKEEGGKKFTATEAMKTLKMTKTTFYKYYGEWKSRNEN